MLTPYRRHKQDCPHRGEGRSHKRCRCPIWVDGIFEGAEIRRSLRVLTWEDADRELEKLKERLKNPAQTGDEPTTLAHAWDGFLADAKARSLKELSLNKYKYLRTDMER